MIIIIENSEEWLKDGQLVSYCETNNLEYKILDIHEIKIENENVYFCNTDIIQKYIKHELIPDTYEDLYKDFYHREFVKIFFKDLSTIDMPIFVKPTLNNKLFNGQVINSIEELILHNNVNYSDDFTVYICNCLKIICEYRLLIGNEKLYGCGFMSGNSNIPSPPKDFINSLVIKTGELYRCIDVGFDILTKKWIVIEINPPFSLSDYGIDINNYMSFCIDFFKHFIHF